MQLKVPLRDFKFHKSFTLHFYTFSVLEKYHAELVIILVVGNKP